MSKHRFNLLELEVLSRFVHNPGQSFYGLELADDFKVSYGTMQPMLVNFKKIGWLEAQWEDIEPSVAGRPKRKLYKISVKGLSEAKQMLEQTAARLQGRVVAA